MSYVYLLLNYGIKNKFKQQQKNPYFPAPPKHTTNNVTSIQNQNSTSLQPKKKPKANPRKKKQTKNPNHINVSLDRIIAFKLAYPGQNYLFETAFTFCIELPEYITIKWVTTLHTLYSIQSKQIMQKMIAEAVEAKLPTHKCSHRPYQHVKNADTQTMFCDSSATDCATAVNIPGSNDNWQFLRIFPTSYCNTNSALKTSLSFLHVRVREDIISTL